MKSERGTVLIATLAAVTLSLIILSAIWTSTLSVQYIESSKFQSQEAKQRVKNKTLEQLINLRGIRHGQSCISNKAAYGKVHTKQFACALYSGSHLKSNLEIIEAARLFSKPSTCLKRSVLYSTSYFHALTSCLEIPSSTEGIILKDNIILSELALSRANPYALLASIGNIDIAELSLSGTTLVIAGGDIHISNLVGQNIFPATLSLRSYKGKISVDSMSGPILINAKAYSRLNLPTNSIQTSNGPRPESLDFEPLGMVSAN